MNPTIEELQQSDKYKLVESVDYSNIAGFVLKNLKPRELILWSFYCFFAFSMILFGYYSGWLIINKSVGVLNLICKTFIYIFISLFPIIPLHELLHGLSFKLMGARKLKFGANLKEMIFYVTVNRFVLNRKQFYFLALTPFVLISGLCGMLLFAINYEIRWIASLILSFHSSCCIGDFILMSYFANLSKGDKIYTYDDTGSQITYYYRKL